MSRNFLDFIDFNVMDGLGQFFFVLSFLVGLGIGDYKLFMIAISASVLWQSALLYAVFGILTIIVLTLLIKLLISFYHAVLE